MPRVALPLAFLLWAPAACQTDKDDSEPPPLDTLDTPQDTAPECAGTAPVITSLWLENTGVQEYEQGDWRPTITIWASATDEDWDLNTYQLSIWYDETVDDAVEQSDATELSNGGTLTSDECGAPEGTVGLRIFLSGGGIAFDTLYEWGAIVTDAHGLTSELAITAGYTPTSEGEDGGS